MNITLLTFIASFLIGGIPFGLLLGKLKGIDIRKTGSGNIGATNLTRALGKRWGISAFVLDFLKGLLPTLIPLYFKLEAPDIKLTTTHLQIVAGLASVLGHIFPVYLKFKGGKGVATTFGVMAGILPWAGLIAGGIWLICFFTTKTVSIASVVCAIGFPIGTFIVYKDRPTEDYWALVTLSLCVMLLIVLRHRSNLARLFKGKENRF